MNVAVRGPHVPASAYLTLGAGTRRAAGPLLDPARFRDEGVEGEPAAGTAHRSLGPGPLGVTSTLTQSKRKAAMDGRILTSACALVPLAGVAPLLGVWYHGAGRWLHMQFARRPELRAAIGGSVAASWTALLCNDPGVVPWTFLTVAMVVLLLHEQLSSGP